MKLFILLQLVILKFLWNHKGPPKSQSNLEKKHKATDIPFCNRLYYKAPVIKIVWFWHEKQCIDQWNRIKNSE